MSFGEIPNKEIVCAFNMLTDLTKLSSKRAVSIYPPPMVSESFLVLPSLATLDIIKLFTFCKTDT